MLCDKSSVFALICAVEPWLLALHSSILARSSIQVLGLESRGDAEEEGVEENRVGGQGEDSEVHGWVPIEGSGVRSLYTGRGRIVSSLGLGFPSRIGSSCIDIGMKKFNEWLEEKHPEYMETSLSRRIAAKGKRLWRQHGDTVKAGVLGAATGAATAHGFGAGAAALPIAAVGGVVGAARQALTSRG